MDTAFGILVVLTAYFIKGLSGFGPALVMVPFLSVLFDPTTAISVTALMDFLAGGFLLPSVRKTVQWKLVLQIFAALALGAVPGTYFLGMIPLQILRKIIGIAILVFAVLILSQKDNNLPAGEAAGKSFWRYPAGFLSGLLGGLLGISGPPLIIYMKLRYPKTFFRSQLIGIFFLGTGWRFFLYRISHIGLNLTPMDLGIFITVMIAGLFAGNRVQIGMSERLFNRIVALLISIPAVRLLF
jgi:uncharacterized membrane protein YfcA